MELQNAILRDCPSSCRASPDWLPYLDKIETKVRADQPGLRANTILSTLYEHAYEVLEVDWNDESYLVICIRKAVLNLYLEPASDDRDENFRSFMSLISFNVRGNAQLYIAFAYYYNLLGQKALAKSFIESKKRYSSMSSYTNLLLEAETLLDNNQSLAGLMGKFHYIPPYPGSPDKPKVDRRRTLPRFTSSSIVKHTPQSVNSSIRETNDSLNFTCVTNLELSSRCNTTGQLLSTYDLPIGSTRMSAMGASSANPALSTGTLPPPGLANRPSTSSSDRRPPSSRSSFCSCFSPLSSSPSCSLHSCSSTGNGRTSVTSVKEAMPQGQRVLNNVSFLPNSSDTTSRSSLELGPLTAGSSTRDTVSSSVSNTLTTGCYRRSGSDTRLSLAPRLVSEVSIQPWERSRVDSNGLSDQTLTSTVEAISTGDPRREKENQPSEATEDRFVVNGNTYWLKEVIGRGGSSLVYAVEEDAVPPRRWALKLVSLAGAPVDVVTAYCNEANMLRSLQETDRVIRLHDCERTPSSLALVMELAEISFVDLLLSIRKYSKSSSSGEGDRAHCDKSVLDGSMNLQLEGDDVGAEDSEATAKPVISLLTISFYWMEMLRCVQAIHDRRIVHLDLKLQNFVVARGKLKLIDLGISQRLPDDMTRVGAVLNMGSLTYMSPEQLEGATALSANCSLFCRSPSAKTELERLKIGRKADIWSLGVILYVITYLRPPFPQANVQARMMAILNPELKVKFPSFGSRSLLQALKRCLVRDFRQRANLDELLALPYPQ